MMQSARDRKRTMDRERQTRKRRAAGDILRDEYTANAVSAEKPWEGEGVSRPTWYRRLRSIPRYVAGDRLLCVDKAPDMKVTVGLEYEVVWSQREDALFPTVENDDGRPTQYSGRWFEKVTP